MKPKKINKKMTLNKKTIANLSNGEMKLAVGGETLKECSSPCETQLPLPRCTVTVEPTCSTATFDTACETYPPMCQG